LSSENSMEGLIQCAANFVPLSPISFIERAAHFYGDRTSIVYGEDRYSWKETHERCVKLASALSCLEISRGDIVAALAPNVPALYELHFAVPMAGAVISALNTRLDADTLSLILKQLEAKLMFVYCKYIDTAKKACKILSQTETIPPKLVLVPDYSNRAATPSSFTTDGLLDYNGLMAMGQPDFEILRPNNECDSISVNYTSGSTGVPKGEVYSHRAAYLNSVLDYSNRAATPSSFTTDGLLDYNGLMAMGQLDFEILRPNNECDPISVNYTSGSTGVPKGAVYSHRAAYLNSVAQILRYDIRQTSVFLWTVDMFRCNGWCLAWTMAALGGINICIESPSARIIFDAIRLHNVTHICGPPAILNMLAKASANDQSHVRHRVNLIVAGALPPNGVVNKIQELGFNIIVGYGMTEVLGPLTVQSWNSPNEGHRDEFDTLLVEGVDVKDQNTMGSVPHDGKTLGEVMFRGNTIMSGYLKNLKASQEAFKGGWFRTGDIGVWHSDGRVQMKDRVTDLVTTGLEAVSTLEVERVLLSYPKVLEAAVVARPDDALGETPCAFVKLKDGCSATSKEIVEFCGQRLVDFMVPKTIVFGNLPVNATGKVQKFVLREKAKALNSLATVD
ncbi:AMP-dependent synthetase/ligase, partial [Dillenia turbinata]